MCGVGGASHDYDGGSGGGPGGAVGGDGAETCVGRGVGEGGEGRVVLRAWSFDGQGDEVGGVKSESGARVGLCAEGKSGD